MTREETIRHNVSSLSLGIQTHARGVVYMQSFIVNQLEKVFSTIFFWERCVTSPKKTAAKEATQLTEYGDSGKEEDLNQESSISTDRETD